MSGALGVSAFAIGLLLVVLFYTMYENRNAPKRSA